ncbi:MAG: Gfo/Idh/MocA family oxidoreductase [Planctomycetia bacterium]|nr:Gfo/Idh/MocA family oxidoreductase [Planctomycetia bacterium]
MIRIGILGCGRILNAHLQGFKQLRDQGDHGFRITALVARDEADAWMFHTRGQGPTPRPPALPSASGDPLAAPHTYLSDFQNDTEVHVYSDYRRLIDDGVADALLDTTPVYLHHTIGLATLDAGLHLLTQKPLAITVRAGHKLVQRAREKHLALGVFENARYRPLTRAVRWAFDRGLLGRPQLALLGALGGPWSPDRIVAGTPWRHDKLLAGGGGSIDIGVHQMNILRYLFGEVQSVQAVARTFEPERGSEKPVRASVDDTYLATVAFAEDAVAQLIWSWAGRGEPFELAGAPAFYGSRGCVKGGQLIMDGGTHLPLLEHFEKELDAARRRTWFPLDLRDPFAILQWQWLEGIRAGDQDPETSGAEGLRDLAAAYAILESSVAGRPVTPDAVLAGTVDAYQRELDLHYGLV